MRKPILQMARPKLNELCDPINNKYLYRKPNQFVSSHRKAKL